MKSCDPNCGPLSLINVSGIPNLENSNFRHGMMVGEVVLVSLTTAGYLE